jgi:hypothetical protein
LSRQNPTCPVFFIHLILANAVAGSWVSGWTFLFIKTIYEVLRKHTIDYKASSTYFNCVQSPLSLIKRGNTFKKSPPWHSWTSNCICKYQMYKKNRTSRILSGQVTFHYIKLHYCSMHTGTLHYWSVHTVTVHLCNLDMFPFIFWGIRGVEIRKCCAKWIY